MRNEKRYKRTGGGVAAYIADGFSYDVFDVSIFNCECLAFWIGKGKEKLLIALFYRSPDSPKNRTFEIIKCINCLTNASKRLVIFGDFNFPKIDWKFPFVQGNGSDSDFLKMCVANGFTQFVNECTRESSGNILDLVLGSHKYIVSEICVSVPFCTADHNSIVCKIDSKVSSPKFVKRRRLFRKARFIEMRQYLNSVNWNEIFENHKGVDDMYQKFSDVLNLLICVYVPLSNGKVQKIFSIISLFKSIQSFARQKNKSVVKLLES